NACLCHHLNLGAELAWAAWPTLWLVGDRGHGCHGYAFRFLGSGSGRASSEGMRRPHISILVKPIAAGSFSCAYLAVRCRSSSRDPPSTWPFTTPLHMGGRASWASTSVRYRPLGYRLLGLRYHPTVTRSRLSAPKLGAVPSGYLPRTRFTSSLT